MWHFSMQGLPANDVTIKSCELLPHFFTLTPNSSPQSGEENGGYFLWHYLLLQHTFQHWLKYPRLSRGALLCTVRTFLPNGNAGAIAQFAANGKFTLKMRINTQKIFRLLHNQNEDHTD